MCSPSNGFCRSSIAPPASRLCKAICACILVYAFALSIKRYFPSLFVGFNGLTPDCENPYGLWSLSEFMVNFEGGFVRRGALGQLLLEVCRRFDVSLLQIVYPLCAAIYIGVTVALVAMFRRRGFCWWIPFMMFLCGYWRSFVRKDFMLVGLMMTSLWLLAGCYNHRRYLMVVLLTVLALFLHEAYLFWGVPLLALIMRAGDRRFSGGFLVISLAIFGVLSLFKGDAETARAIAASWHPLDPDYIPAIPTATVESIGWTLSYAIDHHIGLDFRGLCDLHFFMLPKWIIQVLILIGASYLALNALTFFRRSVTPWSDDERAATFACFLLEMACMLPMFILFSNDYERLWQYVFMALFATVMIIGPARLSSLMPRPLLRVSKRVAAVFDRVLPPNPWATGLVMVTITAFPYTWQLVDFMYQSPALSLLLNRWTLPFFGG